MFGPDRPLGKPGEPAGRPADPDGTGGFFQPGLVGGGGAKATLFEVRLRCALPSATQSVSLEFEHRYRPNANPTIARVEHLQGEVSSVIAEDGDLRLRPGESARLRVWWPDCGEDAPCGGAERYVSYDAEARALVDRRESMTVSWLTTRGQLASPRSGRGDAEQATSADNDLTAPAEVGEATLFIVLRDARAGFPFRSIGVRVQ